MGFARDGTLSNGESLGVITPQHSQNSDFSVDYIRYGIHDPGWHNLSNTILAISGNILTTVKSDSQVKTLNPEPRQRSPDMEGSTL